MGDDGENEAELRERCRLEREAIVEKYDLGREEGARIDDWEDPKLELYHMQDRYGFLHDRRLPDASKRSERERKQIAVEVSRSLKWAGMMKSDEEKKYFGPKAKNREKMINRVHKGVPDSVRGRLWYILLEVDKLKREQRGVYEKMRELARRVSPDIRQIDLDVNRTYRDHIMFRERYNGRQRALFHVLAAYSMYNTEVGYCQGMSQIAAILLMYLNEEEDVFWALSQLMAHPKYAMHGFFIHGFPKLIRFQVHHDKVLKKFLPKLKKHFDKQGVDSGIYTLKWFFQCFLDRIPFSLTLRVWDLYLLEGERVMIAMAYNILRMHRRYLSKLQMDEIIEHLQINLATDFGYDDDIVIERLREVMHELRSQRLDHPGRSPTDELPSKPFGMIPDELKYPPIEKELGLRSGFSDKERKFSEYTIMKQNETERAIKEEEGRKLGVDDDAAFYDEGSDVADESASLPGDSITQPTTTNDDDEDDDNDVMVAGDFDTSFDTSDIIPHDGVRSSTFYDSRSPIPLSEAQNRLDDSVRFMLQSASDLNGQPLTKSASHSGSRSVSQQNNFVSPPSGILDSSFESNPGDVVRIRVPYKKSSSASPSSSSAMASAADLPRYEGNKILITVNHSPLTTPTNSPPDRMGSPTKKKSPSPEKTKPVVTTQVLNKSRDAKFRSSSAQGNDWTSSADVPKSSSSSFRPQNSVDNSTPTSRIRGDMPPSSTTASSATRREVRSYHHESYNSFTSKLVTSSSSSSSTTYLDRRHMSPTAATATPNNTSSNNNNNKV